MLTFEKVLGIFADYLDADETTEVYISRHGCVRVEFGQDFHYCTGEVCHTPKELFDLLADDYRTYLEIELTKGKREVTEDINFGGLVCVQVVRKNPQHFFKGQQDRKSVE